MQNNLTYVIDLFEGPLELLLSLIAKNKVDITDIPISLICDQYMEYLDKARELDMDIASDFIVMASELMLIKSKMLLPKSSEDEVDPRAELADLLLHYQRVKIASEYLSPLYEEFGGRYVKDEDEIPPDRNFIAQLDPMLLKKAISRIILNNKPQETKEVQEKSIKNLLKQPMVSIEAKIEKIIFRLKSEGKLTLDKLLKGHESVDELVATFIGILELIKSGFVVVEDSPYADMPELATISYPESNASNVVEISPMADISTENASEQLQNAIKIDSYDN